jgi:hypothetical protein
MFCCSCGLYTQCPCPGCPQHTDRQLRSSSSSSSHVALSRCPGAGPYTCTRRRPTELCLSQAFMHLCWHATRPQPVCPGPRTKSSACSPGFVFGFVGGVGKQRHAQTMMLPCRYPLLLCCVVCMPTHPNTSTLRTHTHRHNEGTLYASCSSTRLLACLRLLPLVFRYPLHHQAKQGPRPSSSFPLSSSTHLQMVSRGGLRLWLGLKLMTVMAAVHLAFMASSQIKGKQATRQGGCCLGVGGRAAGFTEKWRTTHAHTMRVAAMMREGSAAVVLPSGGLCGGRRRLLLCSSLHNRVKKRQASATAAPHIQKHTRPAHAKAADNTHGHNTPSPPIWRPPTHTSPSLPPSLSTTPQSWAKTCSRTNRHRPPPT